MENLIKIGQISNLYGISIDTLRHYDRKGLLKPVVDPNNGYRYYSLEHLDILEMILVGKHLEIPLDSMKERIEEESIEGYLAMMEEQSRYMEERLQAMKKLNQYTKGMSALLKEIKDFSNDETFSNVTTKEKEDIVIYHVDISNVLSDKKGRKLKGIETFEQWMEYQVDEKGIITDDSQTIGLSVHKSMMSKEELGSMFQGLKQSSIRGTYRSIGFWGSEKELLDYLHRLCKHFNIKKSMIHVKFRFALLHKDQGNEYYTEIYFT